MKVSRLKNIQAESAKLRAKTNSKAISNQRKISLPH